jgi:hypothetical protein
VIAVESDDRVLDFHAESLDLGRVFSLREGVIVHGTAGSDWVESLSPADRSPFERHFHRLGVSHSKPDRDGILRSSPRGVVRASVLKHLGFSFGDAIQAIRSFESGTFLDVLKEFCPEIHSLHEDGRLTDESAFRWALVRFGRITL